MTVRMPTMQGSGPRVTRMVTRTAVLNVVKEAFPDAYIKGNQIVIPNVPADYQVGDMYALRIFTTPSYKE